MVKICMYDISVSLIKISCVLPCVTVEKDSTMYLGSNGQMPLDSAKATLAIGLSPLNIKDRASSIDRCVKLCLEHVDDALKVNNGRGLIDSGPW